MVAQISPTTLFFIEGCGQLSFAMCWGDGFVTDRYLIQNLGLTDPAQFLNQVVGQPFFNNIVISPHYYPPSISGQKTKCALSQPLLTKLPVIERRCLAMYEADRSSAFHERSA